MDREERVEQHRRQLALADPLLPAVWRENDVHLADQRPNDVVRRELAGREATDLTALLAGDRRPDDEVDDRLRDHPDHVEVVRDAVLDVVENRDPEHRRVQIDPAANQASAGHEPIAIELRLARHRWITAGRRPPTPRPPRGYLVHRFPTRKPAR